MTATEASQEMSVLETGCKEKGSSSHCSSSITSAESSNWSGCMKSLKEEEGGASMMTAAVIAIGAMWAALAVQKIAT